MTKVAIDLLAAYGLVSLISNVVIVWGIVHYAVTGRMSCEQYCQKLQDEKQKNKS